MRSLRRRLITIGYILVILTAFVLGAREVAASVRTGTCEDCDPSTDCRTCCKGWGFDNGLCPPGGGSCLCW